MPEPLEPVPKPDSAKTEKGTNNELESGKIPQQYPKSMQQRPSKKLLAIGIVSFVIFHIIAALVFSNLTQSFDAQLALAIYKANLGNTFTSIAILSSKYGREFFWIPIV